MYLIRPTCIHVLRRFHHSPLLTGKTAENFMECVNEIGAICFQEVHMGILVQGPLQFPSQKSKVVVENCKSNRLSEQNRMFAYPEAQWRRSRIEGKPELFFQAMLAVARKRECSSSTWCRSHRKPVGKNHWAISPHSILGGDGCDRSAYVPHRRSLLLVGEQTVQQEAEVQASSSSLW